MATKLITLIWFLGWYCLINILIYIISPLLMFYPPKSNYQNPELSAFNIHYQDKKYAAVHLTTGQKNPVLLYSHGNAVDLKLIYPLLKMFQAKGYDVLAYEYPGYGNTTGFPTEQGTYNAIEAAYQHLITDLGYSASQIIPYGHSIGSGPTLYLASKYEVGGVILESPFLSAFRVLTYVPLLFLDRYPNTKRIKKVKSPVLVIHGTNDEIINFWHGKQLIKHIKSRYIFEPIQGAQHNNILLVAGHKYWEILSKFTQSLQHD